MTTIAERLSSTRLEPDELRRMLRQMMLIRRFEEKAAELYARSRIGGFLHLYIGQEAIAVGAIDAVRAEDYIVSHYREHGHALARGIEPGRIMAELMGREAGVSKGRGGSMHLFDTSHNFMGGYAIVGGHLPIACGLGLACQYLHQGCITLCFLGDGAVNQGEFHESLNLAAVWNLPVLWVCENNRYAMGTDIRHVSAVTEVYRRAQAYGLPAQQVDGMDVLAVRQAVADAAARVRDGRGSEFIEATTYRFRGHSMADPEFYRSKEEIARWRRIDPLQQYRHALEEEEVIAPAEAQALEQDVEREVSEAVRFAEESPEPPLESLCEQIYATDRGS